MDSLILRAATRFLLPLLLLFAVFLLLRGHNSPGGGFIGALVAAAAFSLHALSCGAAATRRLLYVDPRGLIAAGLLTAIVSGALAMFVDRPFLTGLWSKPHLPFLGEIHLGTPLLFDLGVFLTVVGVSMTIVLALLEEN